MELGVSGGAGEASMRTTTKTKTAVAAPINAPRQRTAEGVRAIGRTARGAWCIVADELHCIVRRLVSGDHKDPCWRGGCDTDDDNDDELDNIDMDRARTADRYSAATANRTEDATWALE
jgi:hypothetical protein